MRYPSKKPISKVLMIYNSVNHDNDFIVKIKRNKTTFKAHSKGDIEKKSEKQAVFVICDGPINLIIKFEDEDFFLFPDFIN